MKKLSILLLTLSFSGLSSSFQMECSNSNGSIKYFSGHYKNALVVNDKVNEMKAIQFLSEKVISDKSHDSCTTQSSNDHGIITWERVTVREVQIETEDISDFVICKNVGDSTKPCDH